MKYDENFDFFSSHSEWYEFVINVGYVPTDKAPPEAVEAIKKYNSYRFNQEK